jgi:hypothetical protein
MINDVFRSMHTLGLGMLGFRAPWSLHSLKLDRVRPA